MHYAAYGGLDYEKPQSVSKNGAYRLSKRYIPFPKMILTFFEKAGHRLEKPNFHNRTASVALPADNKTYRHSG
jgi:hypothetical protein